MLVMTELSAVVPLVSTGSIPASPVSPSELLRDILLREIPVALIPGGVAIGSMADSQVKLGCISLMDAGQPGMEEYTPLVHVRAQIRCLAPSLEHVDRIVRVVWSRVQGRNRTIARQDSTSLEFLIHRMRVSAGPSMHRDSPENWETLLFAELLIGLYPVRGPGIT